MYQSVTVQFQLSTFENVFILTICVCFRRPFTSRAGKASAGRLRQRYGRIGRLRARSDFRSVSRARVDEEAPVPRLNLFICNATSNFSNIWIKRDAKKYFLFSGKFGITGLFCWHHRILGHSFTRGCLYGNWNVVDVLRNASPSGRKCRDSS